MNKTRHIFILAGLLLAACSAEPQQQSSSDTAATALVPADSAVALATPQRFLRWYEPRMDSLQTIYPATPTTDTIGRYTKEMQYLTALNGKGFFSPIYLKKHRKFQQTRLNGGVADDLHRDPVIWFHEAGDVSDFLKVRPSLLHYSNNVALIELAPVDMLRSKELLFYLSRRSNGWQIDTIQVKDVIY